MPKETATPTPWFLYVVQCKDGTWYTGISTDVDRRIKEHNQSPKGAKYTKARRPVHLIYQQKFSSQSEALRQEIRFKRLSRKQKEQRIARSPISSGEDEAT